MVSCGYFLYVDGLFSYAGFVSLEVIAITTLMSFMMLDEAISSLHMCTKCFKKKVKVNAAPVHSVGLDYETEDEK
jgi:hypothetical protein